MWLVLWGPIKNTFCYIYIYTYTANVNLSFCSSFADFYDSMKSSRKMLKLLKIDVKSCSGLCAKIRFYWFDIYVYILDSLNDCKRTFNTITTERKLIPNFIYTISKNCYQKTFPNILSIHTLFFYETYSFIAHFPPSVKRELCLMQVLDFFTTTHIFFCSLRKFILFFA